MSSSTGPRTRWSAPPAGPAAGCSIPPPGAGRRTAGWRERPSSPFPGWVCGSPLRPGPDLALFSAAACAGVLRRPAGGPGRDLQHGPGRLSGGLGAGGMPRYFQRRFQRRFQGCGAASSRAFGRSRGLLSGPLSGPPEGLVCPAAGAVPPVLPRGRRAAWRAVRKSGLEGGFFAPSARRFPVRRGAWEARAGRKIAGPQKTDLCKKSAKGYPATGCRVCALGSVQ